MKDKHILKIPSVLGKWPQVMALGTANVIFIMYEICISYIFKSFLKSLKDYRKCPVRFKQILVHRVIKNMAQVPKYPVFS